MGTRLQPVGLLLSPCGDCRRGADLSGRLSSPSLPSSSGGHSAARTAAPSECSEGKGYGGGLTDTHSLGVCLLQLRLCIPVSGAPTQFVYAGLC